jgi:hypothetical protein
MARTDIIQELNGLGSSLTNLSGENIYSVQDGYFEGFAFQVLAAVKSENDELQHISFLTKKNPYHIPAGYFEGLAEITIKNIRAHADYQTSGEELESISPLLSSLNKAPVYSVPVGYFENFQPAVADKPAAKIVSIDSRRWFRYAAAAVVTGIIVLGSVLFFNMKSKIDPRKNPEGWVSKNLKKVSEKDINEFVKLAEEEAAIKEGAVVTVKKEDMKELMKDIPSNEIDQFLSETETYEDASETLLN